MSSAKKQIYYSDKYSDEQYEYRHVMLPKQLSKLVPSSHLMSEDEWRGLGVQQSQGWIHYMIHKPGFVDITSSWQRSCKNGYNFTQERTSHSAIPKTTSQRMRGSRKIIIGS
ncbi:cyclin-dependent kinases regulatory subunit-like isoform X1 [Myxocyprinus asiaticus]|uniref:cyclin-dependent kinases regulatory subunit-like isoform X1 n=1 Tax=Myxocyprinus asiaticus TaxID=70543 RepID=UPI0022232E6D|nr:cyclin-dependent kinases regulatory subunit-like isoform X1 [Myxocyprinus asiaticus]